MLQLYRMGLSKQGLMIFRHLGGLDREAWWLPHAFLLGQLQKKCILINQRLVQRFVWVPEVIEGPLNMSCGPGLAFGTVGVRISCVCAL